MRVRDVMTRGAIPIPSTATVQTAAQTMKVLNLEALPVRDGDSIVGIITDRDIVMRCVAAGLPPTRVTMWDLLSSELAYCYEDEPIAEVSRRMLARNVRHLVVITPDGELAGVISASAVLRRTRRHGTARRLSRLPADSPARHLARLARR